MPSNETPGDGMPVEMTIGEVSARSGVAPSALRYYEERGLLASLRAPSGHRRYPRHVLRRLAFIVFAQRAGCTLDEVRDALDQLPTHRVPSGDDWDRLTRPWIQRVDERIADLQRLRHDLNDCIGCGCLSVAACALVNPGDRAQQWGPGPARWNSVSQSPPRREQSRPASSPASTANLRDGPGPDLAGRARE